MTQVFAYNTCEMHKWKIKWYAQILYGFERKHVFILHSIAEIETWLQSCWDERLSKIAIANDNSLVDQ